MAMNPRWCASLDEWRASFANGSTAAIRRACSRARSSSTSARCGARRASPTELRTTSRRARRQPALPEADERQRARRTARRSTGSAGSPVPRTRAASRASTSRWRGSVPFVDGARIFALASGVTATNTVERFEARASARGDARRARSATGSTRSSSSSCCACARSTGARRGDGDGGRTRTSSRSRTSPSSTAASWTRRCARRNAPAAARGRLPGMSVRLARWLRSAARRAAARDDRERWVVVDTETTGLDPERDALLAIGAVAVDGDRRAAGRQLRGRRAQRRRAGRRGNVALHGIGHGAHRAGVPAATRSRRSATTSPDAPCVGFHADFDRACCDARARAAGVPTTRRAWLDLAPLAAALDAGPRARGRAQPRRLARRVRHRVAGAPQRGRRRARHGGAAACGCASRARAQGARGFAALLRAGAAAEMAGGAR